MVNQESRRLMLMNFFVGIVVFLEKNNDVIRFYLTL